MAVAHTRRVVGREDEVALVREFLDACGTAPAALVVEGEAGIGKSVVLEHAIDLAITGGRCVLRAGPAEAEASVSFGVLDDLLEQVPPDVLEGLPLPLARAIRVALLVEDPGSTPPTARAVALAFRAGRL